MANYKVGDLDVTISGVSKDAVSSLDEVIKQLDALQGKLGIVGKGFSGAFKGINTAAVKATVQGFEEIEQVVESANDSAKTFNATIQNGAPESAEKIQEIVDRAETLVQTFSKFDEARTQVSKLSSELLNIHFETGNFDESKVSEMLALTKQINATNEAFKRLAMTEQELTLYDYQQENASRRQRIAYLNLMLATGQAGEKTREYKQELKQLVKQQQIADKVAGKSATGGLSKLINRIGRIALYRTIRRGLQIITQTFQESIQAYAQVDDNINNMMSQLTSSTKVISLSLGTIIFPILQAMQPIVYDISIGFANMANTINQAMAKMQGLSEYTYINVDALQDYRKQLEKTSGSLFDFDKFRSLSNKQDTSSIFLSKKKLDEENESVSQMMITIKSVTNIIQGLWNVIKSGWNAIKPVVMTALAIINDTIIPALSTIVDWIGKVFKKLDDLKLIHPLLMSIGVALGLLYSQKVISGIASLIKNFNTWYLATGAVAVAIGILSNWDEFSRGTKIAITIISGLTTALLAAATAAMALHGTLTLGTAIPLITAAVASGAIFIRGLVDIPNYATGASDIDSGTIFRAGEAGKTEAVFTGSNGKTNVANVQQMYKAEYMAVLQALKDYGAARGEMPQLQPASDTGIYQAASRGARKVGKTFGNV